MHFSCEARCSFSEAACSFASCWALARLYQRKNLCSQKVLNHLKLSQNLEFWHSLLFLLLSLSSTFHFCWTSQNPKFWHSSLFFFFFIMVRRSQAMHGAQTNNMTLLLKIQWTTRKLSANCYAVSLYVAALNADENLIAHARLSHAKAVENIARNVAGRLPHLDHATRTFFWWPNRIQEYQVESKGPFSIQWSSAPISRRSDFPCKYSSLGAPMKRT